MRRLTWRARVIVAVTLGALFAAGTAWANTSTTRLDWTANRRHTLAPQTKALLTGLREDVTIRGIFKGGNDDREVFEDLGRAYRAVSRRVRFLVVDPDREPGLAAQLSAFAGTVVVTAGQRTEQAGSASEYSISTAIWRVANARRISVCSVKGHGEKSFSDDGPKGYAKLGQQLLSYGITVQEINLLTGLPPGCEVVVVASPKSQFAPQELALLEQLRANGGRILLLLDPDSTPPAGLLEGYQLSSPSGRVLDPEIGVQGDPASIYVEKFPSANPITQGLPPVVLFDVRALVGTPIAQRRSGLWISSLLAASEKAQIEGSGPMPADGLLGAAVDDSHIDSRTSSIRRTRLVAIGDSEFATNLFIEQLGGLSLMVRSMGWLAQAEEFAQLSFKPADVQRLYLTRKDARIIRTVAYGVGPGLFAWAALVVIVRRLRDWGRRRQLDARS